MLESGEERRCIAAVAVKLAGIPVPTQRLTGLETRRYLNLYLKAYCLVMVKAVTSPSVLWANRRPYTPSVDLSFPAATTADLG